MAWLHNGSESDSSDHLKEEHLKTTILMMMDSRNDHSGPVLTVVVVRI